MLSDTVSFVPTSLVHLEEEEKKLCTKKKEEKKNIEKKQKERKGKERNNSYKLI